MEVDRREKVERKEEKCCRRLKEKLVDTRGNDREEGGKTFQTEEKKMARTKEKCFRQREERKRKE